MPDFAGFGQALSRSEGRAEAWPELVEWGASRFLHSPGTREHRLVASRQALARIYDRLAITDHTSATVWHKLATSGHATAAIFRELVTISHKLTTSWQKLAAIFREVAMIFHILVTISHVLVTICHMFTNIFHKLAEFCQILPFSADTFPEIALKNRKTSQNSRYFRLIQPISVTRARKSAFRPGTPQRTSLQRFQLSSRFFINSTDNTNVFYIAIAYNLLTKPAEIQTSFEEARAKYQAWTERPSRINKLNNWDFLQAMIFGERAHRNNPENIVIYDELMRHPLGKEFSLLKFCSKIDEMVAHLMPIRTINTQLLAIHG